MVTSDPGIQAAVNRTRAAPGGVPSGTLKSTLYKFVSPGQPISLITGTSLPFTVTSIGEFTSSGGTAENFLAPDLDRPSRSSIHLVWWNLFCGKENMNKGCN